MDTDQKKPPGDFSHLCLSVFICEPNKKGWRGTPTVTLGQRAAWVGGEPSGTWTICHNKAGVPHKRIGSAARQHGAAAPTPAKDQPLYGSRGWAREITRKRGVAGGGVHELGFVPTIPVAGQGTGVVRIE